MATDNKINQLFELGEVRHFSEWLDYLELGLTEQDVPALLDLVADEKLHNADIESNDVWVPLHAWRALSQIASDQAIVPLIEVLPSLFDDDWALNELPVVLSSHGPAAVKPLVACLNDPDSPEQSRAMITDALPLIVKKHPETRPEVLHAMQEYIAALNAADEGLNSLVICSLMDMQAIELIDDIRQLFENNAVDITLCGDLEEVEIELGLRDERETPKPEYAKLHKVKELSSELKKPDTEDLDALLDYYLQRYENDYSIKNLSELDGFFVALASSPNIVMPADWLNAMWGGKDYLPEWESKEEFEEFSRAILTIYNFVISQLEINIDGFSPMFHQREVESEIYYIVDDWCQGYLRGLDLSSPTALDRAYIDQHIPSILLFSSEELLQQRLAMSNEETIKHQQMIEYEAIKVYQHFYMLRTQPEVNDTPKVGRNDPCPCGSGKKFKKCCLH